MAFVLQDLLERQKMCLQRTLCRTLPPGRFLRDCQAALWAVFIAGRAISWNIVTPSQLFRQCWDAYMIVLILLWVCIIVPFTVCFGIGAPVRSFLGDATPSKPPCCKRLPPGCMCDGMPTRNRHPRAGWGCLFHAGHPGELPHCPLQRAGQACVKP